MEFDYYDISPLVSPRIAVCPGDKKYQRHTHMSFADDQHMELSSIETTLHVGAHADAPNHYHAQGEAIHQRSLSYYYGKAQVIAVNLGRAELITKNHLEGVRILAPRLLFCTNSFPDHEIWNSDFCAFSAELIDDLARNGVRLVGIDTPSVDPEASKDLPAHQAIYRHNMAILEGLVLKGVPAGLYRLVALPLKLENGDASPVRAILVNDL